MSRYARLCRLGCRALAAALVGLLAYCGDEVVAPAPELLVIGTEYAFEAPQQTASGIVTVRLRNNGVEELHNVAVVRLTDDHTLQDFVESKARDPISPAWAVHVGGVESIPPGAEADVVLDLSPGPHLLVCYHELRQPGEIRGQPHHALGMIAPLEVTGRPTNVPEPESDATLAMFDYGFSLSKPLVEGPQVLHVIGAGPQDHNVLLWRLAEGRSPADLIEWLESDRTSARPAQPLGGMTALSAGQQAYLPLNLEPGEYVLVCLVSDREDHRFHVSHGMALEFVVS